jgi:hypothetical protein
VCPHSSAGNISLNRIHTTNGKPSVILNGHFDLVTSTVYRSKYQQLISTSRDGLTLVWAPSKPVEYENDEEELFGENWKELKYKNNNTNTQVGSVSSSSFIPPIIQNYLDERTQLVTNLADDTNSALRPLTTYSSSGNEIHIEENTRRQLIEGLKKPRKRIRRTVI